ncbi:unnamed protein product [Prunus armeniaca]
MTGPPSSSYPGQVPSPAAVVSPENEEKSSGFDRKFAGFVLRRPAAIFGDQVFPAMRYRFGHPRAAGACARISIWISLESRTDIAYRVFSGFARFGPLDGHEAQCEVARVFGLAGVLTDPAQCEVARVFGLAGVLTDPAQCEVARVFGLAGVLTDPVRGRPGLIGKSYVWLDPLVGGDSAEISVGSLVPLILSGKRGHRFKERTRHGGDAGVSAGFVSGFGKFGAGPVSLVSEPGSISCGPRTLCASLSCGIMMGSVTGRHHFDAEDSLTWMDLGY